MHQDQEEGDKDTNRKFYSFTFYGKKVKQNFMPKWYIKENI